MDRSSRYTLMRPLTRLSVTVPVGSTGGSTTGTLGDREIQAALTKHFSPHRCVVLFDGDGKITFRVYTRGGQEFAVEWTRTELLRDPAILSRYLGDVTFLLRQRKVSFNDPGSPPPNRAA
jgi:hypothetical protein